MRVKQVTKKNLEFITKHLEPDDPITIKDKTKTFVFYDDEVKAVVEQKKAKKKQRYEIKKYDENFSLPFSLPVMNAKRIVELPKEKDLEDLMKELKYDKVSESDGYEIYEMKKETIHGLIEMFKNLEEFDIKDQFKNYFDLWEDEPEFKSYEMWRIIANASSGALLGSVMPAFWDYGGVLKLAGTLAAMQKIATPLTNVFTSGTMGNIVDKATVQEDIKNLKNLQKKVGYLYSFMTLDTYLMQPEIIQMSPFPEATLLTLYGIQSVGLTMTKMSLESKSFFAIRDYLIRRNPELESAEYKDKFYQILGTGQALSQLAYASAFIPSWLACKSNPTLIPFVATASAVSLLTAKFYWGFNRCLKNPVSIKADDYIEVDHGFVFDSGWTVASAEPFLEKKFKGYQMPLREGIGIASEFPVELEETNGKIEFANKNSSIKIKIKDKYKISEVADNEYVVKLI